MTFSIRNPYKNIDYARYMAKRAARHVIVKFPMGAKEQNLNDYLVAKYKLELKHLCLYLLDNCKFQDNFNNELVVHFNTLDQDKLAQLITYGNFEIPGSRILQAAFHK